MKRLSTIKRDIQHAMADLEILASQIEDQPGHVTDRAWTVSNLQTAAGGLSMVLGRLG